MKRVTLTVAMLLSILALVGCGPRVTTSTPNELAAVTLRIGDQKGAGLKALLTASKQLDDVPYQIVWSDFTAGLPILEALNAGSIDFGSVGDTPPIFAQAAGTQFKIVGITRSVPKGSAILIPQDSPIKSPADLRGKKVAVRKGSSSHYHLLAVLKEAGLAYSDITPVYLDPPDAMAAFSSSNVDAWAIWDPYTATAQEQTGAQVLVDGQGLLSGYGFQVASEAALADEAKSKALGDFVARLARAYAWADAHPDQWATIWSKQTGLSLTVAQTVVKRINRETILIDDTVITTQQHVADEFAQSGLVPSALTVAPTFDARYNTLLQEIATR